MGFWLALCEFRGQQRASLRNGNVAAKHFLMSIKLPNLAEHEAIRLITCGRIDEKSKSFLQWLNEDRELVSSYKIGDNAYFVRCGTGGFSGHFHLECASSSALGSRPKSTARKKAIDAVVDKILGLPITARVTCYFLVPVSSLAETGIIRTLSASTTAAGVSMKLTAGTLALSGSPIQTIRWELQKGDSLIKIGIVSIRKRILAADYLVEAQAWSRSLFDVMILSGAKQNG